ncbi:MAG: DUF1295 domain-containing protein [Candidatus Hydrogenedentes bacterium]|nr:DUF1295 domain-containing protein [Candidatus Hydrogenedentota bacterium]
MLYILLSAVAGASLLMAALFLVQRRTGDAGIVDVGWSYGVGLMSLWLAWALPGDLLHRLLMALIAVPWSLRLGTYLLMDRVMGSEEDGRYAALRKRWGDAAQRNFFLFFQVQAGFIVLFAIPLFGAGMQSQAPAIWDYLALVTGWGALFGESLADSQLRRWRAHPGNRGKTCRTGLWRYSRHPNYFFEWLHWWAYALLCAGSWWFLAALAGPVLMLLFLYRVTGIPHTEGQALRSRGGDYRAYQKETSAFFPWFPRLR